DRTPSSAGRRGRPPRRRHGRRGPCAAAPRQPLHVHPRRAWRGLGRARPGDRAGRAAGGTGRQLPVRECGRRRRLGRAATLRRAAARSAGCADGGRLHHGRRDAHQQDAHRHEGRDADRADDGGGRRHRRAGKLRHQGHPGLPRRAEGQSGRHLGRRRLGGRDGPHHPRADPEGARALGEGGLLRRLRRRRAGPGGGPRRAGEGGHLRPLGVRRADQVRPHARAGDHGRCARRAGPADAEGCRHRRRHQQLARRLRPARHPPGRAGEAGRADDRAARPAGLEGDAEDARLGGCLPHRRGFQRLPRPGRDADRGGAEGDRARV
ncbi:MAG: Tricarboxylate transport protein TctC, partial [uncultured Craurococcus sp.]